MQTTNDIFVNPSAFKTKIEGELVEDRGQAWGKTKLLGNKREQSFPITKIVTKTKSSIFELFLRL